MKETFSRSMLIFVLAATWQLTAASFIGCEEKLKPTVITVSKNFPDQESWNSTIVFTDSGVTKGILKAGHAVVFNNQNKTYLGDSVRVDFFDEDGKHTSYITSDSGVVDDQTNDLEAIRNVYAHNDSGTSLWTQRLFWNNKMQKVTSDVFVKIVSPSETIQGVGFQSDRDLRNYTIFNVSGESKAAK